jgi:hypothetical protein
MLAHPILKRRRPLAERYELVDTNADIIVHPPGTELGLEPTVQWAVVIGNPWATALAIEGSLPDLTWFAERLLDSVRRTATVAGGDDLPLPPH